MNKKEFLCQYHNLQYKIEKLKEYIKFCDERASSISSPALDGMPKSPNRNTEAPFVKWIYKKIEAEEKLKTLERESEKVKDEIETAIDKLSNTDLQRVLSYHYIDWLSWTVIGNKMFLSKSSLIRLHNTAIDELQIKK